MILHGKIPVHKEGYLMISKPQRALAILLVGIMLAATLPAKPARADIAPPQQPPGSSLKPSQESTLVRMVAERVLIEVRGNTPEGSLGQAAVTATFEMQNLGEKDETMAVRFPISVNDGFYNHPEIADMRATVDGEIVPIRKSTILDDNDNPIQWAKFEASFPASERVTIEVKYLLEGTGEYPFISFAYLLETGAGWQGTIGDVELILRLPYEANPQNVIFDEQIGWSQTTPGGEIEGNEVRWQFQDLEPSRADNLQVSLVMPSAWAVVLGERGNVAADPNDGEAWGRLGKVSKEIIYLRRWQRSDQGGLELYDLSKEAYRKAVDLLPDDPWWHAGYAELLWRGAIDPFNPRGLDELLLTLRELDRTLQLDADNELALEILDWLVYEFPEAVTEQDGGYHFLWLTATPTITTTPTSSPAPILTATQTPTPKPSSSPLPASSAPRPKTVEGTNTPTTSAATSAEDDEGGSNLEVCGVGLMVALLPLGLVLWRRKLGVRN